LAVFRIVSSTPPPAPVPSTPTEVDTNKTFNG
jgi:hypothetical protein